MDGSAVLIASIIADAGRRPIVRLRGARPSEQEVEEARAAITAAVAIHADRHAHRSGRGIGLALDADVGDLALAALQNLDHARVAAIDVLAQLQLAILVDEGSLLVRCTQTNFGRSMLISLSPNIDSSLASV